MANIRLISRLDIKGPNLIKGVHLEGLRVVGDPQDYARQYYATGADELIYMDTVASLYGRNHLGDIVKRVVQDVFIPITVGGGIRSTDDVKQILRCGADKVAINTAAVKRPELITEVSQKFGSQCMVLSIEAMRISENLWHVFTDNGRELTGMDVVKWAQQAVELGAGEILLTSIDQEGTYKGFDIELVKAVSTAVPVPVIASGGFGEVQDLLDVVEKAQADAVAIAGALHYKKTDLTAVRQQAHNNHLHVRQV
ncbi:MAG: imidazole glycerol phosphate synthase cyclase subunit [Gammaproteobacteria bacterium]|nr:imidazole glycerol phosphate synthase cyclase subunit [Gammaproteobacteria bacterium]